MVLISYTHDSEDHSKAVLGLANRLRSEGVDAQIDQYLDSPPEGWPVWMDKKISEAKTVLVVCSRRYNSKSAASNSRKPSGGRWESFLIYQDLYEAAARNNKFIPVLLKKTDKRYIPKPLKSATHYTLPEQYTDLYRHITKQPRNPPPDLGSIDVLPPDSTVPMDKRTDGPPVATATDLTNIELSLDVPFQDFSEEKQDKLLEAVRLLLEDHSVRISNKRKGSTVVAFELTPAQAERLKWAVKRGELDEQLGYEVSYLGKAKKTTSRPLSKAPAAIPSEPSNTFSPCFLGADVKIVGRVSFCGVLKIEGSINGEIHAPEGTVVVESSATLEADIVAANVVVNGVVHGSITASGRVEFGATCELIGDVRASALLMAAGAVFIGASRVGTDES